MKNLTTLFVAFFMIYGIFALIIWDLNVGNWHWVARTLYLIFTLLIYDRVKNKV
mgnify:CR=1 FL=1